MTGRAGGVDRPPRRIGVNRTGKGLGRVGADYCAAGRPFGRHRDNPSARGHIGRRRFRAVEQHERPRFDPGQRVVDDKARADQRRGGHDCDRGDHVARLQLDRDPLPDAIGLHVQREGLRDLPKLEVTQPHVGRDDCLTVGMRHGPARQCGTDVPGLIQCRHQISPNSPARRRTISAQALRSGNPSSSIGRLIIDRRLRSDRPKPMVWVIRAMISTFTLARFPGSS